MLKIKPNPLQRNYFYSIFTIHENLKTGKTQMFCVTNY